MYEPRLQGYGGLAQALVSQTKPDDTRVRISVAATDYWRIHAVSRDYEIGPRHWVVTIQEFDYVSGTHSHQDVPFNYMVISNDS